MKTRRKETSRSNIPESVNLLEPFSQRVQKSLVAHTGYAALSSKKIISSDIERLDLMLSIRSGLAPSNIIPVRMTGEFPFDSLQSEAESHYETDLFGLEALRISEHCYN